MTYLVMDNLSIHKAKCIQELYDISFKCFYLPPYSCVLNPIERVWSIVKREWKKTRINTDFTDCATVEERSKDNVEKLGLILGMNFLD